VGADVIKSYLVKLGFEVEQGSLAKFESGLSTAEHFVTSRIGGMVGDFLKFQVAATGALAAVSFGVVGYIDKLAMGDQQMRLFAMRSFMTLNQARSVSMALKTLGVSIEDVSWDKELHRRFQTLIQDQRQLAAILGPDYELQLHQVRDIVFQLQRLELKGEYFGMKFAGDLLKKLGIGDGNILHSLEQLNNFVLQNFPRWAEELSTDLVPILKDFWGILKDLGGLAGDLALEFTNLVGVFSGDTSIQGAEFDFHKFATAVERVAHWMAELVHYMILAERVATRFAPVIAGIAGGAGVGSLVGGIGAIPGAVIGGIGGLGVMAAEEAGRGASGAPQSTPGRGLADGAVGGSLAQQARTIAQQVSGKTGIPADLLYGQMAHETGNFTNRGSTSLNNFAGIRIPGSTEYRSFGSSAEFGDYYARVLEERRYTSRGINQAKTPEEFARALKGSTGTNEYYTGPETAYAAGVGRGAQAYDRGAGSSTVTVGTINIPITNPGATPAQIHSAVKAGVKSGIDSSNQRQMAEQGGVYQ
jgi:hypothetical protein